MGTLKLILTIVMVAIIFSIMALIPQAQAQVSLHVTLVVDPESGAEGRGAVFRVDPSTGQRKTLIDFGVGPRGASPIDVAIDPSGDLLVTDPDAGTGARGALFRVDPSTGQRSILSDFGDLDLGPLGRDPIAVAMDPSGRIFVLDRSAGTDGRGALFRVDVRTKFEFPFFLRRVGIRTLIGDFGKQSFPDEPLGIALVDLAIDAAGNIVVVDHEAGTDRRGALFRVKLNGERTLVSDFGVADDPKLLGESPAGLAIVEEGFTEDSRFGSILVLSHVEIEG